MAIGESLFRVVLQGYQTGKGEYYVEVDFAKAFKISEKKARDLLTSVPNTIRDNLTLDEAEKYKRVIEKAGARCEVENMKFDVSGLSLE